MEFAHVPIFKEFQPKDLPEVFTVQGGWGHIRSPLKSATRKDKLSLLLLHALSATPSHSGRRTIKDQQSPRIMFQTHLLMETCLGRVQRGRPFSVKGIHTSM